MLTIIYDNTINGIQGDNLDRVGFHYGAQGVFAMLNFPMAKQIVNVIVTYYKCYLFLYMQVHYIRPVI